MRTPADIQAQIDQIEAELRILRAELHSSSATTVVQSIGIQDSELSKLIASKFPAITADRIKCHTTRDTIQVRFWMVSDVQAAKPINDFFENFQLSKVETNFTEERPEHDAFVEQNVVVVSMNASERDILIQGLRLSAPVTQTFPRLTARC